MLLYVVGACKQEEITSKMSPDGSYQRHLHWQIKWAISLKNDLHVSSALWIGPLSGKFTVPECSKYYENKRPSFSSLVHGALIKSVSIPNNYRHLRRIFLDVFLFIVCFLLLQKKDITLTHIWGHLSHHFLFLWKGYASNKHIILIIADCWVGQNSQHHY